MLQGYIEKLLKSGKLKKQKAGIIQVEALLKESMRDLSEAKKIVHLAERATYLLAYMAMLKAGRALMLFKGYVPDDGAQHKTVVEVTGVILGEKYSKIIAHFETMRRKRNELTYEAGVLLSKSESEKALNDAVALVKDILSEVKLSNPQVELPWNV